MMNHKPT